jgi:hypothetical protein
MNVLSEPVEEEVELSAEDQAEPWQKWVDSGPQGPISDEDAGFPPLKE